MTVFEMTRIAFVNAEGASYFHTYFKKEVAGFPEGTNEKSLNFPQAEAEEQTELIQRAVFHFGEELIQFNYEVKVYRFFLTEEQFKERGGFKGRRHNLIDLDAFKPWEIQLMEEDGLTHNIVIELDRNLYKSKKSLVEELMKIVKEDYSEIDFVAVNIRSLD